MKGPMAMEDYRRKIQDLSSMKEEIDRLKGQGKKIVFTNGCFDLHTIFQVRKAEF